MKFLKSNYNIIAVAVFILAIVIAHFFATHNYNWTKNTISDLGSQNYPFKSIMQFGFLGFGLILSFGILASGLTWSKTLILIYGLGVALTGIFCTQPFFPSDHFSISESNMHSLLAQIAGISFTVGILIHLFLAPNPREKWIHLIFFLLVIGFSISFGLSKNHQGIAQRLLYLTSFIWLIKFYKP